MASQSGTANTAIVGLQWGDEGKGKFVDVLAAEHDVVVAQHVMLSYEWSSQSVIVRINDSLKWRGYVTWLDTEQMKGSIMDA